MTKALPSEYFIQGVTEDGQRFRPSDWPERLCGVMSSFGPGASGPNARLKYSFYVRPVMVGDLKCVAVDERLRTLEPAAFDFVMNFAKDNQLIVTQACSLPDFPVQPTTAEKCERHAESGESCDSHLITK